jgi:hypothetical protein
VCISRERDQSGLVLSSLRKNLGVMDADRRAMGEDFGDLVMGRFSREGWDLFVGRERNGQRREDEGRDGVRRREREKGGRTKRVWGETREVEKFRAERRRVAVVGLNMALVERSYRGSTEERERRGEERKAEWISLEIRQLFFY